MSSNQVIVENVCVGLTISNLAVPVLIGWFLFHAPEQTWTRTGDISLTNSLHFGNRCSLPLKRQQNNSVALHAPLSRWLSLPALILLLS